MGRLTAMPPTHVLLDLDGTISDSSIGITRSLQHAFAECGLPAPSVDGVRSIIGPPFEIGLPQIGVAEDDVSRVVDAYRVRYEEVGLFENEVYDGIPEMLEALRGSMTLAVATAKPQQTAERIIDYFGFTAHFATIAGATVELGSSRRTKAQVITHVMADMGLASGSPTMMIGDRDHDVEGASANGIGCIGVTWGFGSADELEAAGATAVVHSPADVVPALSTTYREAPR